MEIPQNDMKIDYVQQLIDKIVPTLVSKGHAVAYWNEVPDEKTATQVGQMFVEKGYYAKMNYFLNDKMQMLIVSKTPLQQTSASKIYDVIL